MTVHMIRIHSHWPDGYTVDEIDARVQSWVDNHTEWTADQVTHTITATNTNPDGSGTDYLTGDFRFESSDEKIPLLDDAERTLQDAVSWYRLCYHVCSHDESSRTGCSWDDAREYGTVPSGVPTC